MKRTMMAAGLMTAAMATAASAMALTPSSVDTIRSGATNVSGSSIINLRPDSTDGPVANSHLFVTHNWNPGGTFGRYWPHAVGYSPGNGFSVVDTDNAPMVAGLTFNAAWMTDAPNVWHHTSTALNTRSGWTYLSNALTDGHPEAIVFVSQRGSVDTHNVGVWYDASVRKWAVYNQDRTPMPVNASFSIYVDSAASFTVKCDTANTSGDTCFLPQTLGESGLGSNMRLIVTPNWNPPGRAGMYNNHPVGVWWDNRTGRWGIYNEDRAPMPVGASFNVSYSAGELTPG